MPLPVVFYIHGGAYYDGGAELFNPDILLDENIVLVTIQYRMGTFGFLALEDPRYSGNQGMKDQLMALEWVTRNIGNFGGDMSHITLWGHSAGSTSVNLLALVPQAKGLFHRAIMTGGSVGNQFSYQSNRNLQKIMIWSTLAKLLRVNEEDLNEEHVIEWLLHSSAVDIENTLCKQAHKIVAQEKGFTLLWAPVVERE